MLMAKMKFNANVDISEIADNLINSLSQDELVEFIKELNREVDDFDFTKELKNYFVAEMEDEEEEDLDYEDAE